MNDSNAQKNDFSKGSVVRSILSLAVPMTLAQLINILYNIIDRMYIGRLPENATLSEAVEFATAAASITVQRMGAQSSIPTRNEINEITH